jgi:glutathione synthase/RimK-type ligase-like ATP-grasp enzyme
VIVVCGAIADSVTELICARLSDCGFPFRLLDLGMFPKEHALDLRWTGDGPAGSLAGPGWRLELDEIHAVFARWPGPEARAGHAELGSEARAAAAMAECDVALIGLFEDLPCLVMNRIAGGLSNHSKPLQALAIERAGLRTPRTLVTTDPAAAEEFIEALDGEVIYKSISGVRSIVRRLSRGQRSRLPLVRHGPCQLQEYLPGRNVRVHTVGGRLFATSIASEAVDYRYASRERRTAELEATELPGDIADACLRLARRLDLAHAGIDLKETPDGRWYCFEINPAPGFIYYERSTGQPISLAVAELLNEGARGLLAAPPAAPAATHSV